MTKVFGAIFCILGSIYLTVSIFLYMNTSAFLDYNAEKPMTFIQSKTPYFFLVSVLLLVFGVIFVNDKVIGKKSH